MYGDEFSKELLKRPSRRTPTALLVEFFGDLLDEARRNFCKFLCSSPQNFQKKIPDKLLEKLPKQLLEEFLQDFLKKYSRKFYGRVSGSISACTFYQFLSFERNIWKNLLEEKFSKKSEKIPGEKLLLELLKFSGKLLE